MIHDLLDPLQSTNVTLVTTWLCIYLLVPFAFLTALFMLKVGPRFTLDWGYAWVMAALGLWVCRIVYITRLVPQPPGESWWSVAFALNLLAAMAFTMALLARTSWDLRGRE